jgi:hypothetical protein
MNLEREELEITDLRKQLADPMTPNPRTDRSSFIHCGIQFLESEISLLKQVLIVLRLRVPIVELSVFCLVMVQFQLFDLNFDCSVLVFLIQETSHMRMLIIWSFSVS